MSPSFIHVTLGQRVRFGSGQASANFAEEVQARDARNVMVISGKRELTLAEKVAADIDVRV